MTIINKRFILFLSLCFFATSAYSNVVSIYDNLYQDEPVTSETISLMHTQAPLKSAESGPDNVENSLIINAYGYLKDGKKNLFKEYLQLGQKHSMPKLELTYAIDLIYSGQYLDGFGLLHLLDVAKDLSDQNFIEGYGLNFIIHEALLIKQTKSLKNSKYYDFEANKKWMDQIRETYSLAKKVISLNSSKIRSVYTYDHKNNDEFENIFEKDAKIFIDKVEKFCKDLGVVSGEDKCKLLSVSKE